MLPEISERQLIKKWTMEKNFENPPGTLPNPLQL